MLVNDSSTGLLKIAFLAILIIGGLTFFGGLAIADTGLLNWRMQEAEATALEAQTLIDAQRAAVELPYIKEQLRLDNDRRRLEYELAASALVAENNRIQNFRIYRDTIVLGVGGFAGIVAVVIPAYILLRLVGQAFDRRALVHPTPGRTHLDNVEPPFVPQSNNLGAQRKPQIQQVYLRRNSRDYEPVDTAPDEVPFQHQSGHTGNGRSEQRVS